MYLQKVFINSSRYVAIQNQQPSRKLWWWVNMMFNRMDQERVKALGYDRAATEWLLRNGACVRFIGSSDNLLCDYNALPPENTKFQVKEIEAVNSGISGIGFPHLKGCLKLDRIHFDNCSYIDDEALMQLDLRKDSLKVLEILNCKNITEQGLKSLLNLALLERLVIKNAPYVKNATEIEKELRERLTKCHVDIKAD